MSFKRVMAANDLWNGEMKQVIVEGKKVLLAKFEDHIFAYEDRCPHQAIALSTGTLAGHVITCAAHHWQYDLRSGHGINPKTVKLRVFPVRIDHDAITVDVGSDDNAD